MSEPVQPLVNLPANTRAEIARASVTGADLARTFDVSRNYWSKRLRGIVEMSYPDIEHVALMCRIHPAELLGGQAPAGWTPPEPPQPRKDSKLLQLDLNQQPFD